LPTCGGAPDGGAPDGGGVLTSAEASAAPEASGPSNQSGCAITSGASGAPGQGRLYAAFATIALLARRRRRVHAAT
jgi:hypothetical protein